MIRKWFKDGGSAAVPAVAALYLCGGCAEPPVPTTIAISPASATLHSLGETVQLTATVEDQYGQAMTGTANRVIQQGHLRCGGGRGRIGNRGRDGVGHRGNHG